MTFSTIETSNQDGRPLFLYEFALGTQIWRYTSADTPVTSGGNLYAPIMIDDDGVKQTGEVQTDNFNIRMPFNSPVPQLFQVTPPINPITVKRLGKHEDDVDWVITYVGFINQVNASEPGLAELECITLSPTMQRNGLRLTWQRGCPYALYAPATCKVDKNNFAVTVTVTTAAAGQVSGAEFALMEDGWFNGGFIEWTAQATGSLERRGIDSHLGTTIRLLGKSDGILEGMAVKAYPGCLRIASVCDSKFNNLVNYGGFPHLPGKSPFGADPLY